MLNLSFMITSDKYQPYTENLNNMGVKGKFTTSNRSVNVQWQALASILYVVKHSENGGQWARGCAVKHYFSSMFSQYVMMTSSTSGVINPQSFVLVGGSTKDHEDAVTKKLTFMYFCLPSFVLYLVFTGTPKHI